MTIPAPQGSIPFVDQDRTPSNSAMIFLQQLRSMVNSLSGSGGGGGGPTAFPLKAPDGTFTAPSYSWLNEANTGYYRASLNNIHFAINGADVINFSPNTFVMGGNAASGQQGTFYYPQDISSNPANGYTIKINRLMVGLETTFSSAGNRSSLPWNATYLNGDADVFASIAVISQVGGYPVVGSTRTSDFRTAYGSASNGSGTYFLAVNDDTTGGPIASGCNPVAWRASGVGGVTEACQCDVENAGSVVDVDPHVGFASGATIALNVTSGAFGAANNSSVGITFSKGGGGGVLRKAIAMMGNSIDTSVGTGGGGVFADLPSGATLRWMNTGTGAINAELGGVASYVAANALGIISGAGNGGTVTQLTNINTSVTLNKICGQITTVSNAFTSGNAVSFQLNNTQIASTDVVVCVSGTSNILATPAVVASNSVSIVLQPLANTTTAVVINFMVLKSVTT